MTRSYHLWPGSQRPARAVSSSTPAPPHRVFLDWIDSIDSIEGIDMIAGFACFYSRLTLSSAHYDRNAGIDWNHPRVVGNLYVHVKDERRYLFVREDAEHTPFIFDAHRWKLVVSGYVVSDRDLADILSSAQYFEYSMPRARFR